MVPTGERDGPKVLMIAKMMMTSFLLVVKVAKKSRDNSKLDLSNGNGLTMMMLLTHKNLSIKQVPEEKFPMKPLLLLKRVLLNLKPKKKKLRNPRKKRKRKRLKVRKPPIKKSSKMLRN